MWLQHTRTLAHISHHGGRCLTVLHEYAARISTVFTKDHSTLKSSCCSLKISPSQNSLILSLHLPLSFPCCPAFPLHPTPPCQINESMGPTEGAHSLFIPDHFFFYSLNLELPWQQEEQGWRGKRKCLFCPTGGSAVESLTNDLLDVDYKSAVSVLLTRR